MYPKPKKSLGQNFLTDKNVQEKIFRFCNLTKNDTVLEIGPGRGEITSWLIQIAKRVIAIEIDIKLCEILRLRFKENTNFELLSQDILKTNLSKWKNLKVVTNAPYYISTPIIEHLLNTNNRKSIKSIYLTLQRELAGRILAAPGNKEYSAFSCFVQYYTKPKLLFYIKNNSFWPKPKVDSSFIELRILNRPPVRASDEKLFFKLVRSAFNQRRKAIKNSLSKLLPQNKIVKALKLSKLDPNSRAENLSLKNFAHLSNLLLKDNSVKIY